MSDSRPTSTTSSVRHITIDAEHEGQRIDNFLLNVLKGAPRSLVYRIIRRGEVRVNGGRTKPEYRLQQDDTVRVPPVSTKPANSIPEQHHPGIKRLQNNILFEDDGLLILNKPAGIAVHGGSGVQHGVIEMLRVMYPNLKRLELVHRLDRDTSGCLLVAKKNSVLRGLHEQLRFNRIEKIYLALVKGNLGKKQLIVDLPLKKNTLQSGERVVRVNDEGKEAKTIFMPQQTFVLATLARVKLMTGRTHQIRVHAQVSGHPVAGDPKYGDDEFNKKLKNLGLKRMFLHAHELRFEHPLSGETLKISAPLDTELENVLKALTNE